MAVPPPVPLHEWAAAIISGRLHIHASGVAIEGQGVLIRGASGSGKSSLALELLVHGAALIADDGLWIDLGDGTGSVPQIERPETATDLVESRGFGLLRAGMICRRAPLALAIDLDLPEPDRLPPRRMVTSGVVETPLIHGAGHPKLAAAVLQMIRYGRVEPG